MSKDWKDLKKDKEQGSADRSEDKSEEKSSEMSMEEAKAYRASLYKPAVRSLTEQEKREEFRLFWAMEKYKYGKSKDLEQILWLHLKASKLDNPENFQEGLSHFGLKKIN